MLVLHIGTHKTGTSALQQFLTRNTDLLRTHGVHYLAAGRPEGTEANHRLAWAARGDYHMTVWDDLRAELDGSAATVNVASSEGFWFCDAAIVRAQIPQHVQVKIVVYLRRQDKYLQSLYKQTVVGGRKMNFAKWLKKFSFRGDYLAIVENWATHFGAENVVIRSYELGGKTVDSTQDFFSIIGAPEATAAHKRRRGNPSPRKELVHLFRALNQGGYAVNRDKLFYAVIKKNPAYIRSADMMTHKQAAALLDDFAAGNRELLTRYYRGEGELFPPLENAPDPDIWPAGGPEFFALTVDFLDELMKLAMAGEVKQEKQMSKRKIAIARAAAEMALERNGADGDA